MGRFYKTANANPIDYMYRINSPLMEKVIASTDQSIGNELNASDQIGALSNYDHVAGDDTDAATITKAYTDQVNNISDVIRKDPANWRRQLDPIRSLKQKLVADYQTGAIGKQMKNYALRKQSFDQADKQVDLWHTSGGTKGLNPTAAAAYKAHWDSQFTKTGYDPANPSAYNTYKGGVAMDDMDVQKLMTEGMDKIKANKRFTITQSPYGKTMYFDKETNKTEEITPERLISIAMGKVTPEVMAYLKERSSLGLISGVVDSQGKMISPYSSGPIDNSPEEDAQIKTLQSHIDSTKDPKAKEILKSQLNDYTTSLQGRRKLNINEKSYLGNILNGAIDQFGQNDVQKFSELSGDPVKIHMDTQAQENYRQNRTLSQALAIHLDTQKAANEKADRAFNEQVREFDVNQADKAAQLANKAAEQQYQHDHPKGIGTGIAGLSGVATKAAGTVTPPAETTTSKLSTNSFEANMTENINGKKVKEFSPEGLSGDIKTYKNTVKAGKDRLNVLENLIAGNNDPNSPFVAGWKEEKAGLQKSLVVSEDILNYKRGLYAKMDKIALSGAVENGVTISPEEKKLYEEFKDDRHGEEFNKKILKLKKQYPDIVNQVKQGTFNATTGTTIFDPENRVESPQVAAEREKWAGYQSAKEKIDKNRDLAMEKMRRSYISSDAIVPIQKESLEVREMMLNNPQGLQLFNGDGSKPDKTVSKNMFNSDFNMNFEGGNDLTSYIKKYNVGVNIEQIGTTTNIGNGNAVMKVSFTDPNNKIPAGKTFYIATSPDLERDLSTKFSKHPNKDVAAIGQTMGDNVANDLRKQLRTANLTETFGKGNNIAKKILVDGLHGDKIPLNIIYLDDGTLSVTDGNHMSFPRADHQTNGIFKGVEDFIVQFKAVKAQEEAAELLKKNATTTQ